ncbi:hypothetical protein ANTPLA_LOCUS10360 [Anthophora plagiata]
MPRVHAAVLSPCQRLDFEFSINGVSFPHAIRLFYAGQLFGHCERCKEKGDPRVCLERALNGTQVLRNFVSLL